MNRHRLFVIGHEIEPIDATDFRSRAGDHEWRRGGYVIVTALTPRGDRYVWTVQVGHVPELGTYVELGDTL